LRKLGAHEIYIANRTFSRAESLARELNVTAVAVEKITTDRLKSLELFVNCSPVGSPQSKQATDYPFDLSVLSAQTTIFDCVTSPTKLTAAARAAGSTVIEGSRMLLFQALEQFRLFTGEKAPQAAMEQALLRELTK
jgi:shikimate 5-dehydrogenase